jgi:hypothetical protein
MDFIEVPRPSSPLPVTELTIRETGTMETAENLVKQSARRYNPLAGLFDFTTTVRRARGESVTKLCQENQKANHFCLLRFAV